MPDIQIRTRSVQVSSPTGGDAKIVATREKAVEVEGQQFVQPQRPVSKLLSEVVDTSVTLADGKVLTATQVLEALFLFGSAL